MSQSDAHASLTAPSAGHWPCTCTLMASRLPQPIVPMYRIQTRTDFEKSDDRARVEQDRQTRARELSDKLAHDHMKETRDIKEQSRRAAAKFGSSPPCIALRCRRCICVCIYVIIIIITSGHFLIDALTHNILYIYIYTYIYIYIYIDCMQPHRAGRVRSQALSQGSHGKLWCTIRVDC
jgi:hypothetical protein